MSAPRAALRLHLPDPKGREALGPRWQMEAKCRSRNATRRRGGGLGGTGEGPPWGSSRLRRRRGLAPYSKNTARRSYPAHPLTKAPARPKSSVVSGSIRHNVLPSPAAHCQPPPTMERVGPSGCIAPSFARPEGERGPPGGLGGKWRRSAGRGTRPDAEGGPGGDWRRSPLGVSRLRRRRGLAPYSKNTARRSYPDLPPTKPPARPRPAPSPARPPPQTQPIRRSRRRSTAPQAAHPPRGCPPPSAARRRRA